MRYMTTYTIKHLSTQFIKRWIVLEGRYTVAWCDTRQEARDKVRAQQVKDAIRLLESGSRELWTIVYCLALVAKLRGLSEIEYPQD